jgi:hypothetical protein
MRFTARNILLALAVGVGGAMLICGLLAFAAHAEAATRKIAPPRPVVQGQTANVAGRDLAVTVYNENLGVVKDKRRFDVGRGVSEVEFTEVASAIDPTSVHLRSLDKSDVDILSQDYRYDLVSTDKLLEKYVDSSIDVATKDNETKHGSLLSFDPSSMVLRGADGGLTLLNRAEVRQVSLRDLPQGLITRPTLVWRLRAAQAGARDFEVSYMTGEMSWHAEYVAVVTESGSSLDLQGWASVENRSGATYEDAKLKLVAGSIHRAATPPRPYAAEMAMQRVGGVAMTERGFAEYHLYELPERATLANNETKQLSLLSADGVRSVRKFTYDGSVDADHVQVRLEFQNDAASGLGMPLPEGVIRAFQRDTDGSLELVGEDRIQHTPRGQTVRVAVGSAFDVAAERKQTDLRQVAKTQIETSYEITLTNRRKDAMDVTVIEHATGDWEILKSTHPYQKKDSRTFEFTVRCPPDQPVTVGYTIRTRA